MKICSYKIQASFACLGCVQPFLISSKKNNIANVINFMPQTQFIFMDKTYWDLAKVPAAVV